MITVSTRELLHHFSDYLEKVKQGDHIVVMQRNKPVADLILHNENIQQPAWKREIPKLRLTGVSLSKEVSKHREEER